MQEHKAKPLRVFVGSKLDQIRLAILFGKIKGQN